MERTGQARRADIDVTCDLIARKWESRPDSGAFRPPFWAQVGQFGLILCWKPDAHVQDVAKIVPRYAKKGKKKCQEQCQEIAFSIFDLHGTFLALSWHFSWHFWCLSYRILGHLGAILATSCRIWRPKKCKDKCQDGASSIFHLSY